MAGFRFPYDIGSTLDPWREELGRDFEIVVARLSERDRTIEEYTKFADPVGHVQMYAGATAPQGWLLCDGTAVSRATYKELFSVLGTAYGVGDGSTTFNLPNLKGRVPTGLDATQTEFDAMGETGGAKTHTLTSSEMPSHTHTTQNHDHNAVTGTTDAGAGDDVLRWNSPNGDREAGVGTDLQGNTNLSHTHSIPAVNVLIDATGGGGAHQNLVPYLVMNFIIRF